MIFSSIVFLFYFLPLTLIVYFLTPSRLKNLILLVFSLFFYAWGEGAYVLLMLGVIALNYGGALVIGRLQAANRSARLVLAVTIVANLAVLGYYKYAGFLVENVNTLLTALAIPPLEIPQTPLPIGISFFTFQAVSYLIDVYRKDAAASRSFIKVGLYIALFPQLIAGPILRYIDIEAQITERKITRERLAYGIRRFTVGLGKKVLIANNVALVADRIFALELQDLSTDLSWLGIIAYTLQIYFDFSGYSDMAVGLGAMFGFRIIENFNYPYIANSIRDFWRRWHISLSTWFRDYLYIPLGGNRVGKFRTYLNLYIVFFVTGLWHGASWNFVLWGLLHGTFLVIERLGFDRVIRRWWPPLQHLYVLLVVMCGWVLFRALTLEGALGYLGTMFSLRARSPLQPLDLYISNEGWIALALGILFSAPLQGLGMSLLRPAVEGRSLVMRQGVFLLQFVAIALVFLLVVLSLSSSAYNPFIYFRF